MIALLLACASDPPVAAPTEIDDLSAYLYANFNGNGADGAEALPAGMVTLDNYLSGLDLSLDSDLEGRSVSLSHLVESDLDNTSAPEGVALADQVSVAVSGETGLTMDQELAMIMDPNQVCIASDTTAYHAVTVTSGGDCFQDGACDVMQTTNEIFIDDISDGWLDTQKDYRWVEMDDGRKAVVAREWMPEVAEGGLSSWDQRFAIVVWLPNAEGTSTMRYYAMWSSITSILTDEAYSDKVVNGLNEYYVNSVAHTNGEECDNDRDREYDRE